MGGYNFQIMRLNTSLQKGLKILDFIAKSDRGAKLTDCAKVCDLASSNTSLFLNTLVHAGYIFKDNVTGNYCISDKLSELAQHNKMDVYAQLKIVALSEMQRLHKLYNENVVISIMSRNHLSIIQEILSTQAIRIINRTEDLFQPHVTAAGKAILAHMDKKKLRNYLKQCDYQKITQHSINNEADLIKELEMISKRGWATNIGEYNPQVYGVAAPIFSNQQVIAALIVQYPGFRHDEKQLEVYAQEVLNSAREISEELTEQD